MQQLRSIERGVVALKMEAKRSATKAYRQASEFMRIDRVGKYGGLRLKAQTALVALMEDQTSPPNVRAIAARTLLELVGAIGARRKTEQEQRLEDSLDPDNLSLIDIDRELSKLR
jgi:hypothetical protein